MSASSSPSVAGRRPYQNRHGRQRTTERVRLVAPVLDPPVPVLEPSDWFSELTEEFKVS